MNPVGWFEIPVVDMDRAVGFYSDVFQIELSINQMGEILMAWFPFEDGKGASGSLCYHPEFYKPSEGKGVVIYFTAPDIEDVLKRVNNNGGRTVVPKRLISEDVGYMAVFIDSEGNRIALHSRK